MGRATRLSHALCMRHQVSNNRRRQRPLETNRVTGEYQVVRKVASAFQISLPVDQAPRKVLTESDWNACRELLFSYSDRQPRVQKKTVTGPTKSVACTDDITERNPVDPGTEVYRYSPRLNQRVREAGPD